ncbi:PH domain-containing protein, partial [Flavobacterium sp.]|uniref:PH domain-containing protein n=1 Tax=Flavobacterium sp. TaxID=239 RepID=UPI003751AC80
METNFNKPQRQSSIGILILFVDSLQKFARAFLPIVFIWFFKAQGMSRLYVLLGLVAIIALVGILAYLRFLNFTFYIDDENDEFIVNDGIINKTKTTIQLNKIQQVNIHQNLIQRLIGVYALTVDTAGSDKKEGNIKAISHSLALALKSKLLDNEAIKKEVTEEEIISETLTEAKPSQHPFLKISVISLLKVGITSNYVRSIGLILTFFFTIIENLRNIGKDDVIDEDKIGKVIDNYPAIYAILFFIVVLFAIIFVINIGRTLLKYFNYTIT